MKDEYSESLLTLIKSKKNDDPKTSYTALLHKKTANASDELSSLEKEKIFDMLNDSGSEEGDDG